MKDRLYEWLAYRLPHNLVYYAAIRMFAHATTGKYEKQEVPACTLIEALSRWEFKT